MHVPSVVLRLARSSNWRARFRHSLWLVALFHNLLLHASLLRVEALPLLLLNIVVTVTVILRCFLKIGSERWLLLIFSEVCLNPLGYLVLLQVDMLRNFDIY